MTNSNGDRLTQIEIITAQNTRQIAQLTSSIADLRDVTRDLADRQQNTEQRLNNFVEASNYNFEALTTNQRELQQLVQQIALSQVNLNEIVIPQMAERIEENNQAIREMQAEIRGLQTENRRIIDRVFGEENGE